MAVKFVHKNSKLKFVVNTGTDDDNKPVKKNKTIDHLRPEAKGEVLFKIASTCASLQGHQLSDVFRLDEYRLEEE